MGIVWSFAVNSIPKCVKISLSLEFGIADKTTCILWYMPWMEGCVCVCMLEGVVSTFTKLCGQIKQLDYIFPWNPHKFQVVLAYLFGSSSSPHPRYIVFRIKPTSRNVKGLNLQTLPSTLVVTEQLKRERPWGLPWRPMVKTLLPLQEPG